jgi:spermidine/putrescine ABC transporter ATP-binding subunit
MEYIRGSGIVGSESAFLKLDQVTKSYEEHVAVSRFSLEINEYEFVTLLGPSGSGKTTLLMAIAGFVRPDSGRIFIQGRDISAEPPHRRGIGVVFQNYALFPHMSVYENVVYPLKMRRTSRIEARRAVEKILEVVQLSGMEERRPAQLSGGQQQRVALARALVFKPPILLMDEPLSALDRKLREYMQLELKRIQRQLGITVVYVTHDQEEALTMSSRIAVMNRGGIEQVGTSSEIYDSPATRFVAEFVGETNLFECRVVSSEGDLVNLEGVYCRKARARAAKPVLTGDLVHLAVRPEKLFPVNGRNPGGCTLEGTVEDVVYLGDITRYLVRLSDGKQNEARTVVMKVQNCHSAVKLDRGNRLRIGWNETDGVIV